MVALLYSADSLGSRYLFCYSTNRINLINYAKFTFPTHTAMSSIHGIPWCDLDVKYTTDKIPPGWHVGCGVRLAKYIEACEDWRKLKGYDDEAGMVVALRSRLKGTVRETSDAHRELKKAPENVHDADG